MKWANCSFPQDKACWDFLVIWYIVWDMLIFFILLSFVLILKLEMDAAIQELSQDSWNLRYLAHK